MKLSIIKLSNWITFLIISTISFIIDYFNNNKKPFLAHGCVKVSVFVNQKL